MKALPLYSEFFNSTTGNNSLLIILHGLYGSSRNWRTIGRSISASNPLYSIALVDLRNHGKSTHSPTHSIEEMSVDLLSFIKGQSSSYKNITLAGHSMGGRVAMRLVTNTNEHLLNGLILLDISPFSHGLDHVKEKLFHVSLIRDLKSILNFTTISEARLFLKEKNYKDNLIEWILATNFKGLNVNSTSPASNPKLQIALNLDAVEKFILSNQLYPIAENLTSDHSEMVYKYPFLKPTLFIKGSKSNYVTEKDFDDINKFFPKNQIVEIPSAGHWVHADAPVLVSSEISTFLSTLAQI